MISLDKDENEIENENSPAEQEIVPAESESRQLSPLLSSRYQTLPVGQNVRHFADHYGIAGYSVYLNNSHRRHPGRTAHYFGRLSDAFSKSSRGGRRKSCRQRWRKHARELRDIY